MLATALVPGAAHVLAGSRRFGRIGLRIWLFGWLLLIVVAILALVWRPPLAFVLSTIAGLRVARWLLIGFGVVWCVFGIDTLRLARLIRIESSVRPLYGIVAFVLAVVPLFIGALAGAQVYKGEQAVQGLFSGPSAGMKLPADGRINVLLLGGDSGEDRAGRRPDSISVLSFDAFSGRLVSIGVPRTMRAFPFSAGPMHDRYPNGYVRCNVDVCHLNSVYTEVTYWKYDIYQDAADHGSEPGIEATRSAVEGITGLDIQYYAMVDMGGFAQLIDAMGGVEIDATERVAKGTNNDGTNPNWRPPTEWIEPGPQRMNGDTALWYARSRYQTTDYARMLRQRQLQNAVIEQLPARLLDDPRPIIDATQEVVTTDIPQGAIGLIAELALRSRGSADNVDLELTPPLVDPDAPDFDAVHRYVRQAIAGEPVGGQG